MPVRTPIRTIGLLSYPGVQLATVHGLTDLFLTANRFTGGAGSDAISPLQVSHWQAASNGIDVVFSNTEPHPQELTVLIVPPSLDDEPVHSLADGVLDWIVARHRSGTIVCSICKAAHVLARCGLLDGRAATTHWALADEFAAAYPGVELHMDQIVVDDGDIITSGGVMAWIDLALSIIERLSGTAVMLDVARFFLVDPPGREQRFYRTFIPRYNHGDDTVLKAQRWMQRHIDKPATQRQIAAAVAVSERTLVRRFQTVFAMSPASYLQKLRVNRARSLLELSAASWNEISWQVGYADPGSFRKVFIRIVGLTPADYRRRFGSAARRAAAAT